VAVAQLTYQGSGRDLPCFVGGERSIDELRDRFQLQLNKRQYARHVDDMVTRSIDHWTTNCYDRYQRCMLGIM
jgi:phosphatidylinositol 4-kinase B